MVLLLRSGSPTLSSSALTILHCYTNCYVKSVTPPSEVFCLLRVCYQNGSSDILLVEVAGFAPASTTTFKQLLRIYKNHYCDYCHNQHTKVEIGTANTHLVYTFFIWHYRTPKSQRTKRIVNTPAKSFNAPYCRAFCSGVQSFFQYLFIFYP